MEKVYMPMGFEKTVGAHYGRMEGKTKKIIELCDEKYKKWLFNFLKYFNILRWFVKWLQKPIQ